MANKENVKQKYTVLRTGRSGNQGEVLELHPRQARFLLTEQVIAKGELKGKALTDAVAALPKPVQAKKDAE